MVSCPRTSLSTIEQCSKICFRLTTSMLQSLSENSEKYFGASHKKYTNLHTYPGSVLDIYLNGNNIFLCLFLKMSVLYNSIFRLNSIRDIFTYCEWLWYLNESLSLRICYSCHFAILSLANDTKDCDLNDTITNTLNYSLETNDGSCSLCETLNDSFFVLEGFSLHPEVYYS